jgi:hypothetical protein
MNGSMNGYRLLGYVVWRGAKWYLRRRLPSRRVAVATALGLLGAGAAAAVLLRRATA